MCLFIGLLSFNEWGAGSEWSMMVGSSKVNRMWIQGEFQGWEIWPKAVHSQGGRISLYQKDTFLCGVLKVREHCEPNPMGKLVGCSWQTLSWLLKYGSKGAARVSDKWVEAPFQSHPAPESGGSLDQTWMLVSKRDQKACRLTRTGKSQKPLGW